jgi:8-oxo-dGTP pyrophosphatase MutT (NUDIX family)
MKSRVTETIILGAISSLLATAIVFLFDYSSGKPLDNTQKSLITWVAILLGVPTISILILKGLNILVKNRIRPRIEEEVRVALTDDLVKALETRLRGELESKTGIVQLFDNFRECEAEILEGVKKSKTVRVFLQIGKTVLGGSTNFYDYLAGVIQQAAEAGEPVGKVRILHASLESPYLSERIAHERSSDYREWVVDLDHAALKIENLLERSKDTLKSREHKEGYIWRLFIYDDFAYVQPYLYPRNNSEKSPVLKLSRFLTTSAGEENPSSLYKVFLNYFDFKWDENRPDITSLSELIPSTDATAVAVVARYHQFYVFAIPSRYIKPDSKEVAFHGIGGKRRPGEDWVAAVEREASEEVGVEVSIRSAPRTRFHTTGAELRPIQLEDSPRPYCVYKRTREADPNFAHPEVLWLVGYEGELRIKSLDELRPKAEVGALLCLTGDMLLRTLQEKLTYGEIEKAKGGGGKLIDPGNRLDRNARAVPAGLAIIAAAELPPKLPLRNL